MRRYLHRVPRPRPSSLVGLVALVFTLSLAACARGRLSTTLENDLFARFSLRDDSNYTNGIAVAYTPDDVNVYEVGQKMYTPEDLASPFKIRSDRPYAGQLWAGAARRSSKVLRRGGVLRQELGVRIGVVGPGSLASEAQKFIHNDLNLGVPPRGWRHQIESEVTIGAHYMRDQTYLQFGRGAWNGDLTGMARLSLGTDVTRARFGGRIRFGLNVIRRTNSAGSGTISPSGGALPALHELPGTDIIEHSAPTYETLASMSDDDTWSRRMFVSTAAMRATKDEPPRAYLSIGAQAHCTLYNIFIDNHLFRDGTSLSLRPLGFDLTAGVHFEWKNVHVGYQHVMRTQEFDGDGGRSIGSFVIGFPIGRH